MYPVLFSRYKKAAPLFQRAVKGAHCTHHYWVSGLFHLLLILTDSKQFVSLFPSSGEKVGRKAPTYWIRHKPAPSDRLN
jgi:hypothetical protein